MDGTGDFALAGRRVHALAEWPPPAYRVAHHALIPERTPRMNKITLHPHEALALVWAAIDWDVTSTHEGYAGESRATSWHLCEASEGGKVAAWR